MKLFNTIASIVDKGLITSTVITGGVYNATFASDVSLPVGIALSGTSLLFSLATAITQNYLKYLLPNKKNTMQLSCLLKAS